MMHRRPNIRRNPPENRIVDAISVLLLMHVPLGTFFPLEMYLSPFRDREITFAVPMSQLTWVVIVCYSFYLGIQVILAKRFRENYLLYIFLAAVFFSGGASEWQSLGLLRALRVFALVLFGITIAQYYDLGKAFRLLVTAFLISAIISIIMSSLLPEYGISRIGGAYEAAWRGAQIHKNTAGQVYSLGFLVSFFAGRTNLVSQKLSLMTAAACAVMVLMADSATAISAMLLSVAICSVLGTLASAPIRVRGFVFLIACLAVTVTMLATYLNLEALAKMADRDLTFTGRSDIWSAVWKLIQEQPWRGYGYGFWTSDYNPARREVWTAVGDTATHSHNSVLDLWLQLGFLPMALLVTTVLNTLRRLTAIYLRHGSRPVLLPISIFIFIVICASTETLFSDPCIVGNFWLALFTAQLPAYAALNPKRMKRRPPLAHAANMEALAWAR